MNALPALLWLFFLLFQIPQQATEEKPVLLLNGTAHIGNGQTIDNAAIAFKDGRLTMIADATRIRLDMSAFRVVKVFGQHIYAATLADRDSLATASHIRYAIPLDTASLVIDPLRIGMQEGKEATLIVTDKPLGKSKPNLVMAFVEGRKVDVCKKRLRSLK